MDNFTRISLPASEAVTPQDTPQDTPQVTPQVTSQVKLLLAIFSGEHNRQELQDLLDLSDRKHFREKYLMPAIDAVLVVLVKNENKYSKNPKYKLSPIGLKVKSMNSH